MAVNEEERMLPLLPLRGILVYPGMVLHLDVGREKSIESLEKAMVDENLLLLSTQREIQIEDPEPKDIYSVGTIVKVRQMLKLPNGTIRVLVEGMQRARILEYLKTDQYFEVRLEHIQEINRDDLDIMALMRSVLDHFEQYLRLSKKLSPDIYAAVSDIEEPGRLSDLIASHLPIKTSEKQSLLETIDVQTTIGKITGNYPQ